MTRHPISLTVNGEVITAEVRSAQLLSDFLRTELALTGTKRGCETGTCGACSVTMDGDVVKSCLCLAVQADGAVIETVEGLGTHDAPSALQRAFMEHGGLQCGYCTPGFLMVAKDLLSRNHDPDEAEIRAALSGNLCRCTGYQGIVDAIAAAAKDLHHGH